MNTRILKCLDNARRHTIAQLGNIQLSERLLAPIVSRLSKTADVNPYGSWSIWISVDNRDDLALALSLAPHWKKSPESDAISYRATVDNTELRVIASSDALPPTCKLVEEEFEIPAEPAKEARIVKRLVLKCDTPPENADFAAVEVPAINPAQAIQ